MFFQELFPEHKCQQHISKSSETCSWIWKPLLALIAAPNSSQNLLGILQINSPACLPLPKYIFPKYTYSHNIYFKNIYFQNIYLQNIFFGIFKYSSICLTPVTLSLPTLCLGEKGGQARKKITKRFVFEFSVKTLKSSIKCLKNIWTLLDLFIQELIFCPKTTRCSLAEML